MKKILIAVASLAVAAAPFAASAQSYGRHRDNDGWNARGSQDRSYSGRDGRGDYGRSYERGYDPRGRGDYRYDSNRNDGGTAILAGIAGLLLGSALSGSSQTHGYSQSYGYSQPYNYAPAYAQRCGWQNQEYEDGYRNVEYRQIQVCR